VVLVYDITILALSSWNYIPRGIFSGANFEAIRAALLLGASDLLAEGRLGGRRAYAADAP
jgi:hypothetical protein